MESTLNAQLAKSMSRISPRRLSDTDSRSAREKRLDEAFLKFTAKLTQDRSGWAPRWTMNLRAEIWARLSLECRELVRDSGVPKPDQNFDLEEIPAWFPTGYRSLAADLMKVLIEPRTQAIIGPRGTGKSSLAFGLVLKFCDICRPAIYRTVGEMFQELSNATWDQKQKIREKYFAVDLLVLDEVQVRDDRAWQDNELTTLIDRRYREDKSTLLISNLQVDDLRQNLGDSIWRRLIETGGPPVATESWGPIEELKTAHVEATKAQRGAARAGTVKI